MSKSLSVFLMVVSFSYSMDSHKLFHEANDLFINKKYKKSIELYEKIIDSGKKNSTVFYNLGNAYYRLGNIGHALWAYKHANKFSPRDKDIIHNLKILFFIFSLLWIKQIFSGKKNVLSKSIFQILLTVIITVHAVILDMAFERKRISNEAIIVGKSDAQSGPFLGDNKILFQINEGCVVEVLEEKNNWSEIILLDGKKGWVFSNALRKMK